jgi:hypothetical protein
MEFAATFASNKSRSALETSVRALQLLKNLSSANITGVIVSAPEYRTLQAVNKYYYLYLEPFLKISFYSDDFLDLLQLSVLFFACGGNRRKAKRNAELLDDIEIVCWYLLDTHLERRNVSELDRMLAVLKTTTQDRKNFTVDPPLSEYLCCLLITFKVYLHRHWAPNQRHGIHTKKERIRNGEADNLEESDGDLRRELEVIALKFVINTSWDDSDDVIGRLGQIIFLIDPLIVHIPHSYYSVSFKGVLRLLAELSKNPFNREMLILVEAHILGKVIL